MALEVVERAAGVGFRVATLGPISLVVMDGMPAMEALEHIDANQTELATRLGKYVALSIIQPERIAPPTGEFREKSAQLQAKHSPSITASAVVIRSKGVAAVITRAFLAGTALLVPQENPQQTFRDLEEAVKWLQSKSPEVLALGPGLIGVIEAYAAKGGRASGRE